MDASPLTRFISDVHTEAVLGTASENASPTASVDHRCISVPWISSPTLRPCVSDPSISHHHVRARLSPTPPAACSCHDYSCAAGVLPICFVLILLQAGYRELSSLPVARSPRYPPYISLPSTSIVLSTSHQCPIFGELQ